MHLCCTGILPSASLPILLQDQSKLLEGVRRENQVMDSFVMSVDTSDDVFTVMKERRWKWAGNLARVYTRVIVKA